MKVDKNNSWKEKIDPAFDDLIKVHLDYIELTHICRPARPMAGGFETLRPWLVP